MRTVPYRPLASELGIGRTGDPLVGAGLPGRRGFAKLVP
jgi:hypothetical protein